MSLNVNMLRTRSLKPLLLIQLQKLKNGFETYRVADAVEAVLNLAKRSNKYIDETAPWALAKGRKPKIKTRYGSLQSS